MVFNALLIHEVTIIRPKIIKDKYNEQIPDYNDIQKFQLKGRLTPTSAHLNENETELTSKRYFRFSYKEFEFKKWDRVRYKDLVMELYSLEQEAYGFKALHHKRVNLVEVL